jgi:hypothetical protein
LRHEHHDDERGDGDDDLGHADGLHQPLVRGKKKATSTPAVLGPTTAG